MGYTNARSFRKTKDNSTEVAWLNGVECTGPTSCECLNRCYKLPTPLKPVTCSENEYVTIECDFDSTYINHPRNFTAGSEDTCVYGDACNGKSVCNSHLPLIAGVGGGLGAIIAILAVIVTCFALSSCPLAKCKERKDYKMINY